MLKNIAYIGKREVNKNHKDENAYHLKAWQHYQIVDACWPGIIEKELFESVQKAIAYARDGERNRLDGAERRVFLVSGLLRCRTCGMALFGQSAHGKAKILRYYAHKQVLGETITCPIKRFSADEIEDAIIHHLSEVVLKVGYLDGIGDNIQKISGSNVTSVKALQEQRIKDLKKIESEIDAIFRLMGSLPETSASNAIVKEKLQTLSEKKITLVSAITDATNQLSESVTASEAKTVIRDRVNDFKRGWKKATPSTKKRLIRNLFDRLFFGEDGLSIFYDISSETVHAGVENEKKRTPGSIPGVPPFLSRFPFTLLAGGHSDELLRVGLVGGAVVSINHYRFLTQMYNNVISLYNPIL